ncbi:MAG: PAS domain S-box protein [Desulfomonile sp.]|nr:PAS domain S-box protein [Desulfomonile sp.]
MVGSSGIVSKKAAPFFSLRSKMLVGFGSIFVAVYLLLVVLWMFGIPFTEYGGLYAQEQNQVLNELSLVADLKKERMELWLNERKTNAAALAHNRVVWGSLKDLTVLSGESGAGTADSDIQRLHETILERFKQITSLYKAYWKIQATDPKTGRVMISTDPEDIGKDVSHWRSFRKALELPNQVAVSVEKHRPDNRTCLVISHAIEDLSGEAAPQRNIVGVLAMHIDTEVFLRPLFYTGAGLGKTDDVVLVDKDARILVTLKYPLADGSAAKTLEHKITARPALLASQGYEGTIAGKDYRGVPVLAAYRHINVGPDEGWGLVVKRDQAEVFAPLHRMLAQTAAAAVFGMVLGGILILLISTRVSRPIEDLSHAAEEIEAGNLEARAAISRRDEVGRLAATFNSMAERIQHWHEDLQEQVQVRTAQLHDTNESLVAEIKRRARLEESLVRANRALKILSDCNQALIRAKDEQSLVNRICQVIVDVGGFAAAWITYAGESAVWGICALPDTKKLPAVAEADRGLKAAREAIATGEPAIAVVEPAIDAEGKSGPPITGMWLGLPIKIEERTIAALVILSIDHEGFERGEKQLIPELTEDIAYGIASLRLKERLMESEMRFRSLFDAAGDCIYILEAEGPNEGRIIMANRTAAEQHGYTMEELTRLSIRDLDTPASALEQPKRHQRCLSGETVRERAEHRRKDGTVFPVEINARLIELGGHKYILAIDRDITEQELSRAALSESEERLRAIVDSSPVGIRVVQDGRYVYANPAFVRLFGYESADSIIGLPLEALYAPEEHARIQRRSADRKAGGKVETHYEAIGIKADGQPFDMEVWTSRITYEGKPAALGFVLDISEPKSLRSQLIQAQKLEAIGTLAGGIAHDFNNILTVILGYGEILLAEKKFGDPDREDLERIVHAAQSGADLVRMLLTFSRRIEPQLRPVDLNHLLEHVKKMLSRMVPKMIDIELRPAERLEAVHADPAQVEQVLVNLAVNARDAMPDGGRFTIETRSVTLDDEYCGTHVGVTPGRYVMLAVSDTGHGMDRETLAHIFEPFFTTKEAGRGTGLGLSMVYGIVKQHRGHITCYSEPGVGTEFKVYFPALEEPAASGEKAPEAQLPSSGSETVLLVDDEGSIRELGTKILRHAGYEVLTAANGREAVEIYHRDRSRIALVVLDLIMPEMGGRQCLEQLLVIDPRVKVIIASGYTANGPLKTVIKSGARSHVRKPYNMKEFLETVRKVLDEK